MTKSTVEYVPEWLSIPGGIALLIGVALNAVLEAGSKFKDWIDLLSPEDKGSADPSSASVNTGGGDYVGRDKNVTVGTQGVAAGGDIINSPITINANQEEKRLEGGFVPPATIETYIPRGEIETQVRERLAKRKVTAIVGLHAPGGLGKTELAKRAADELKKQGHFDDVYWIDVGIKTPQQIIASLALQCGLKFPPKLEYAGQVTEIKRYFQNQKRLLVVLDDIRPQNVDNLADFIPPSPPCAALITSRIQNLSAIPATATLSLERMSPLQAKQLLESILTKERVQAEPEAAESIIQRCQYNPLALNIAARRVLSRSAFEKPIGWFAKKLEKHLSELQIGKDSRLNLFAIFDISYQALTPENQINFHKLAAFAATGFTPNAAAYVWGISEEKTNTIITTLLNFYLLKPVPSAHERYRLHDLLDEYAAQKLAQSSNEEKARRSQAEYILEFFGMHYNDDLSTAPHVPAEIDNLHQAIEFAKTQASGELLGQLATKPRNWI
ncbi:MAG: hypothetical protein B6I38_11765, partial [Anaerolineaceae bacterium 4572_5.1]